MEDTNTIMVIQTGGTIDKEYPKTIKGYAFEIGEPAVKRILDRIKPGCSVNLTYVSVCRKDSQDITDEDRAKVADICSRMTYSKILITHGTDTMIETASFVARLVKDKTIVITGAFLPETFKNSDADFNVGLAIGALQSNTYPGVYIAMNRCVFPWSECRRDPETNMFTRIYPC